MLRHVGSGFPNFPRQVCPALVRARQVQIGSINHIQPQCRILREYALLDTFGSQDAWYSFQFPPSCHRFKHGTLSAMYSGGMLNSCTINVKPPRFDTVCITTLSIAVVSFQIKAPRINLVTAWLLQWPASASPSQHHNQKNLSFADRRKFLLLCPQLIFPCCLPPPSRLFR